MYVRVCLFVCVCVREREKDLMREGGKKQDTEGERVSVNFTNILSAVFILADPKSVKNTVKSSVYFGLSGSARVKAARKNLMKLTLGWLEKSEPCFLVTLRHVIPCRFCQHQLQRTSYVKRLTKIDLDGERKRDKTEKQRNVK